MSHSAANTKSPPVVINPTPDDYIELQNPREEAPFTRYYPELDPEECIPVYRYSNSKIYQQILENSVGIDKYNNRQQRVDIIRQGKVKAPSFRKLSKEEIVNQQKTIDLALPISSTILSATKNVNEAPDTQELKLNKPSEGKPLAQLVRGPHSNALLKRLGFFNIDVNTNKKTTLPSVYLRPDYSKDELVRGKLIYNSQNFQVCYDMDETDLLFLNWLNSLSEDGTQLSMEQFEIIITFFEFRLYQIERILPPTIKDRTTIDFQQQQHALFYGSDDGTGCHDQDEQACAVCGSSDCDNTNSIIFCDGCDIAVHQDCYGVSFIPEGPWLCRRCLIARNTHEQCLFCPSTTGAFKQTDGGDWAHVLCTLWTPELYFANPIYMEPVEGISAIPRSRWRLVCFICKQKTGCCIQCSKSSCFAAYHVTCAKRAGLYMKMKKGIKDAIANKTHLTSFCDKHTPHEWSLTHDVKSGIEKTRLYFRDKSKDSIQNDVTNDLTFVTNQEYHELNQTKSKDFRWRFKSNDYVIPSVIIDELLSFNAENKLPNVTRLLLNQVSRYYTLKRGHIGKSLIKRPDVFNHAMIPENELTRRDSSVEFFQKDLQRLLELSQLVSNRSKLSKTLFEEKLKFYDLYENPKQWIYKNLLSFFDNYLKELVNSGSVKPTIPKYAVKPTIYQIIENVESMKYLDVEEVIGDIEKFGNWILNVQLHTTSGIFDLQKQFKVWQRYKKSKYQISREYFHLASEHWDSMKGEYVKSGNQISYLPVPKSAEEAEKVIKRKRKSTSLTRLGIDISKFSNGNGFQERHLRKRVKSSTSSPEPGLASATVTANGDDNKASNALKARLNRVKQRTNVQNLQKRAAKK
jgi:NuA3 HAT complex component NTO1